VPIGEENTNGWTVMAPLSDDSDEEAAALVALPEGVEEALDDCEELADTVEDAELLLLPLAESEDDFASVMEDDAALDVTEGATVYVAPPTSVVTPDEAKVNCCDPPMADKRVTNSVEEADELSAIPGLAEALTDALEDAPEVKDVSEADGPLPGTSVNSSTTDCNTGFNSKGIQRTRVAPMRRINDACSLMSVNMTVK
jgi:hypothetical protein